MAISPEITGLISGITVAVLTLTGIWLQAKLKRSTEAEAADLAADDSIFTKQASWIDSLEGRLKEIDGRVTKLENENSGLRIRLQNMVLWAMHFMANVTAHNRSDLIPKPLPKDLQSTDSDSSTEDEDVAA